ncbi:MAG TPA: amino acid adenylation domain-containing protein, partial [Thermoanaerobaculia bacterium]
MEAVSEFLNELASKGVKLSAEAGQLSCYAPKGTLTSELRDGIVRYKSEIIALLEGWEQKQSTPAEDRPAARAAEFPLSAGQQGLYILQKLHPAMSAYNVPLCFRIEGEVDVELMANAWALVLEQFPILTARVIERDGALYQRLDDGCKTTLQQHAVRFDDDAALLSFVRKQAKAPFDLNDGPLTRPELFLLGERSAILLITIHHIVFDGTSAMILLGRLLSFYQQIRDGKQVRISELPGYEAFVAWEEAMLAGPEGASHAAYWQQQLSGELPVLEILPELPRVISPTFEGRTLVEDLPESLASSVKAFVKEHALPPSAMFLAVFQLVLHKYSSQDEIIVGMPVMGRAAHRFAADIGYFINMVPLRTRFSDQLGLRDYLRNVQATMLDALYHSSYPFPLMLEKLEARQLRKDPVFQVSYAYQNFMKLPTAPIQHQALQVESIAGVFQEGESDLGLEIYETANSFTVHLKYNPDIYTAKTIRRLFAHYCELLQSVSQNPDLPLHAYSILSEEERAQLLTGFNPPRVDYSTDKCLHELFGRQVELQPAAPAVVFGNEQLTYEQLYTRSTDLALYLQSQGVGPDRLVGLCMERSLDMLVGMLGILQAGGAYVPLDPEHPDERLAYMLRDSSASILLTQQALQEKLSALLPPETRLIALDRQWPEIEAAVGELKSAGTRLERHVKPDHLAYVIYTSGSTGQPKGVAIEHHSPVTLVHWASEVYSHEELARVLASTSICFDLSVYEIFVTLANGGAIILVPNALGLVNLPSAEGVTLINTVPSAMEELVRLGAIPDSVQTVNLAGEPLSPALVDRIYTSTPVGKVYDLYGPSEDTTYSTYVLRTLNGPQTIGRPVANTEVYILDRHNQLQPAGVPGELHIAGDGLARGYLHRPELTREKFVANPFRPGTRMYKTGDLARWNDDGTLQYLGRIDTQVKVRGYRIEMGEIEARLAEHSAIQDCAVIAQGQGANKQLIAFYRAKETTADNRVEVPSDELRAHLLRSLPDYMVPSAFVGLTAIPLNPNGKVDRRALARIDVTLGSRAYVAPRSETEAKLTTIWADVLSIAPEKIGVEDNFFELGGHSLLATQLISKIRTQMGVELPLKAVFDAGSIAELARLIARAEQSDIPPIRPVDRSELERLPLSFAQERLWFLNQLEPGSAGYNVPGAVVISGELDVDRLEDAFNLIIARHENLRTVFPSEGGRARQRILERLDFALERLDVSHYETRQSREEAAGELCRADAAAPFDLANGPLVRGKVIRLAGDEHVVMLNMHHIISDGWSVGVLIRELGIILDAFRDGRAPRLYPLPIQYADYSVWQRRWLEEGGVLEAQLAYWQQKLAGVPESLDLVTDYPRPSVQAFAGATHTFTLDAQLTGDLRSLAEQEGGTLYMALLAAFKLLLYRYTGQNDICVGAPIANRQYGETEALIGMFVNTLALRSQVEADDTFSSLFAKVKATCLEAYDHQDAPFERVIEMLHLDRNLALSPLFQVMLILQNVNIGAPDARIRRYPVSSGISKFDLTVELTETPAGLDGVIEYSTALYKPETIARLAAHFEAVCRAITAAPAVPVRAVDYLGSFEKQRLLVDYNATRAEYPKDRCLHELFVEQVALHPEKIAAVCGEQHLTYQQLHGRSRDLALYLQAQGVGPDTLVCLCLERSLEMVVGLLGVVQAGGAYVPLDPEYPDERLAYMFRDSGSSIVLTNERLAARLAPLIAPDAKLVALDGEWEAIVDVAIERKARNVQLRREVKPHHLAYVIYTSGSTGEPKGVLVEHRNLANLVEWHRTAFGLSERDVTTAIAGVGFDAAVWEIWPALCTGATLASPAPGVLRDPEALLKWWASLPIDVSFLPTPLAEFAFSRRISNEHLRVLLVGGDRLDQLPLQPEPFLLVNNYGPTECTVVATSGVLESSDEVLHIGRPISNTQIYILDADRQPVPIGVPGEIYIGGASVARGYLNRPELTAERFVRDPFSSERGARMYRTGDLARWRDDGNIQYLGRIDAQVKIRGFRIELGEIEACLKQHPAIQDSAVIAQGQGAGKQLVAFYRAAGTAAGQLVELSGEELRAHVLRTLPEYMAPVAFVSLAAIPLNPNGKVDRRALAQLDVTIAGHSQYIAPRNEAEAQLVRIWSEVLNRAPETIGVNDNFFELGGHSLLATQLISRIRTQLEIDLPLKALFEDGTVAQLAELIASGEKSGVPRIVPVDRAQLERLPLSFAQERLWFLNELEPGSAGYNVPGAVTIRGALDVAQLEEAFNVVIARHETLRTVFPSEGGQAQQHILDRLDFVLQRVDVSHYEAGEARSQAAKAVCLMDASAPFDLASGPLLRGKVIRLAEDEHVLMLNMHHIISDGWSVGVLIRELGLVLDALRTGRSPELPPLPIQYVDYSVWQRRWLEDEGVLERQLAYWRHKLAGVPESLDLLTDYPRPSVQTFAGATQSFVIDAELTAQLRRLAEREGGTLYMVLLAAFNTLMYRYTAQDDICIGTPIANRQYGETEGLIGMFVNTLALRTQVGGSDTFNELLARVKATCLEAYEHQDAPFEKVIDALHVQRNLAISPLFQVMLILQSSELAAPDASITPYPLDSGIGKFDLSVDFAETAEGLNGSIRYRTALYKGETVARMIAHFGALCRAIVANPGAEVRELQYLSEAERQTLLVDFNYTVADYPSDKSVHQLFAEQAAENPERTAVVFRGQSLTYRELYDRSGELALFLRAQGVAANTLVGISVERSPEMIVALLAIFRAGGAYVPLDPDLPSARLQCMLQDAAPAVVLTQEHLKASLPVTVPLIALDTDWSVIEQAARNGAHALPADGSPHDLAYVIYTSGSTGLPKGVMVQHGSLTNYLSWVTRFLAGRGVEILPAVTNLSFDASLKQIFGPLITGRTVVLHESVSADPEGLLRTLDEGTATGLNCVPSVWQLLLELIEARHDVNIPNLKSLLLGGEEIPRELIRRSLRVIPDLQITNLYGPTEATANATCASAITADDVSIGRPVANTRIYILDAHRQPVPIGVIGEIYIGGAGVARGYLNRPELNAERFLADPFSTAADAR